MNSQKKVNEKLFGKTNKTELAAQKVELALADDINLLLDKAYQLTDVDSIVLNAISKLEKSIPILKETIKKSEDALQKVKDLGITGGVDKVFENKKNEASSILKSAERRINGLNNFRK